MMCWVVVFGDFGEVYGLYFILYIVYFYMFKNFIEKINILILVYYD